MSNETIWLAIGLGAQGCFSLRFLWQWIVSERAGSSQIPVSFWYLSLVGGSLLFVYAVHRLDPVFMIGQGMGVLVYVRNLRLIYKNRTGAVPAEPGALRAGHASPGTTRHHHAPHRRSAVARH